MNQDTNNTGDAGATTSDMEGKTFSQDDVNRIVGERLSKEKAKAEADLTKREQELQHRENLLSARTALSNRNIPTELADIFSLSDMEAFEKGMDILQKHIDSEIKKSTESDRPRPPAGAIYGGAKQQGMLTSGVTDGIRVAMGLRK